MGLILDKSIWTPEKRVADLPYCLRKPFALEANSLYFELKRSKLTVVLVPAPEPKHSGHMIRVAIEHNPYWYSQIYWENFHFRRDRSLESLDRIRDMEDRYYDPESKNQRYRYDFLYRDFIKHLLLHGYEDHGEEVPPNKEAVNYFLKEGLESKLISS